MKTLRPIALEAIASARSQPVVSALTVLMVAAMVFTVMLTTGKAVGSEQKVLGTIDSIGTRTLVVRAEADAGVLNDVMSRVEDIVGVTWALGFSPAQDVMNSAFEDGTPVPVRFAYGTQLGSLGIPERQPISDDLAYVSPEALSLLGLEYPSGSISLNSGAAIAVVGKIETPEVLDQFEPLVVVPRQDSTTDNQPLGLVVVTVDAPENVEAVGKAVLSVLAATDSTKVKIESSKELAELRASIQSQLGSFSRALVLALFSVTAVLLTVVMTGLVLMRRKDFGRRRALGGTRSFVFLMLLMQTSILSLAGALAGSLTSLTLLAGSGDPLPGMSFSVSVITLTLGTALIAGVIPALIASKREPMKELRVA